MTGAEPLDLILGRVADRAGLDLTRFLRIASALARALGQMHRQGLVHKDLKPDNVLVDQLGHVRLTGFGISSRLRRERQVLAPPEVIVGTFAYMAPEQTGRMNRSVDARSDLYSLGVTLYEVLTGALPFNASEPMEWIHCHIARQPPSPSERVRALPIAIADILLKLLAKNPEDRYQTARGVETDLRRCLAAWVSGQDIERFALAEQDVPERLVMPEQLYGRAAEIEVLLGAFERVVSAGSCELILVSGHAGIGKSSMVSELYKVMVPSRGLFATGKCDQYQRNIPYATLAQAFQGLVRQILSKNDRELALWRNQLLLALGPNGQLMVNLIPELALVIGDQPPIPRVEPQDAATRFHLVFRNLLSVFARQEHPLVLFLDDLQWLDTATLELLQRLVTDSESHYLMLIGAYRDNEVGPTHPLSSTLSIIRAAGGAVSQVSLAPLGIEHVAELVADALHTNVDRARPLAALVSEKTGGNPFFVIQFITTLAEEGLLTFADESWSWQWDVERIVAKGITDNVADLMAAKLSRLSSDTRQALGQLACLGNVSELSTLALVRSASEEQVQAALADALEAGLILSIDRSFAFVHDRVHEAAYALIPQGEQAAAHLRIGRVLASLTPASELEEKIFEIVSHFQRGAAVIDSLAERDRVAELDLIAGKTRPDVERVLFRAGLFFYGASAPGRGQLGASLSVDLRARVASGGMRDRRRRAKHCRRAAQRSFAASCGSCRSCRRRLSDRAVVLYDGQKRTRRRSLTRVPSARWDRLVRATDGSASAAGVSGNAPSASDTANGNPDRHAQNERSRLYRHHGRTDRAISSRVRVRQVSFGARPAAHDQLELGAGQLREFERCLLGIEHGAGLAFRRPRDRLRPRSARLRTGGSTRRGSL
ncbi:MAG: AAA family ATPase [Pseudomonadota bacterium]